MCLSAARDKHKNETKEPCTPDGVSGSEWHPARVGWCVPINRNICICIRSCDLCIYICVYETTYLNIYIYIYYVCMNRHKFISIYIRHRPSGRQGVWCDLCLLSGSPPCGWKSFRKFQTSFWISTLRREIPPEIRLHLSEDLTDSKENWLKINSLSGAGVPANLKMWPLSHETVCFDSKCHYRQGRGPSRLPLASAPGTPRRHENSNKNPTAISIAQTLPKKSAIRPPGEGPKGPNMDPKSTQNLRNWRLETVLDGHPLKNMQIANPHNICYVSITSKTSPKPYFMLIFRSQAGLGGSPEGVPKTTGKMILLSYRKHLKIVPSSIKN